jgi:hypothetical protein
MNERHIIAGWFAGLGLLLCLGGFIIVPAMRRWAYEKDFLDRALVQSALVKSEYVDRYGKSAEESVDAQALMRDAAPADETPPRDSAGRPLDARAWTEDGKLFVCIHARGYDGKPATADDLHLLEAYPLDSSDRAPTIRLRYGPCPGQ